MKHIAPSLATATKTSTSTVTVRPNAPSAKGRKKHLGRDAWLTAARSALIREGIGGVEVGKLARKLRATRGGFYWFFSSRKELLDAILADWEATNSAPFRAIGRDEGTDGAAEFRTLFDIWLREKSYSPQWDAAVREWARIAPHVTTVVRRVDEARIAIIERIFEDMGYEGDEALVRARTTYFHQVGYYTLGVHESLEERLKFAPLYVRLLTRPNS
jgi:AcrR family transcriptional regulator